MELFPRGQRKQFFETEICKALEKIGAYSNEKRKKSQEIYEQISKSVDGFRKKYSLDVFQSYLSTQSKNPESRITRDVGGQGYYLKKVSQKATAAIEELKKDAVPEDLDASITGRKRREIERPLYPILLRWLQQQGFRTMDTSNKKSMGKWGNPDITWIKTEENLGGTFDIEIATVEAKVTSDNYQLDIFEAVSHKRFANRAYFAFAASNDYIGKQNDELRYYSELYKVGILVVAMDQNVFEKYITGNISKIELDDADVYEMFSAPFELKQNRWQNEFFRALEIGSQKSLLKWGESGMDIE